MKEKIDGLREWARSRARLRLKVPPASRAAARKLIGAAGKREATRSRARAASVARR
jgi:hypothetical protein